MWVYGIKQLTAGAGNEGAEAAQGSARSSRVRVSGAGENRWLLAQAVTDAHPLPQVVLTCAEAARGWGSGDGGR
jgi:hypothetical protein